MTAVAVLCAWPAPPALDRGSRDRLAPGAAGLPPLSGWARKSRENRGSLSAPPPPLRVRRGPDTRYSRGCLRAGCCLVVGDESHPKTGPRLGWRRTECLASPQLTTTGEASGDGVPDRKALGTAALPALSGWARKSMKNRGSLSAPRIGCPRARRLGLRQFFGVPGCSTAGGHQPSNGAGFDLSELSMAAGGSAALMYRWRSSDDEADTA